MTVRKRKGINPPFAVGILAIVFIFCFGFGFFFLKIQNASLEKLEANMLESAISQYLKQIKNNDFDTIYENSLIISPHLNSKEDYISTLKNIYGETDLSDLTYVKNPASEDLYQIIENDKLIAELQLINKDNKWIANTIFKGDNNYVIQIPENIDLIINDIKVDDSYISQKKVTANNFNGLDDTGNAPEVNTYEIKNLISEPDITLDNNYDIIKDVISNYYYVGVKTEDADLINTVANAAEILAKYPTKDSLFSAVSGITIKNSDFYRRISSLDNQWYAAHGTATISNLNVSKIIKQSDNTMIANVSLDFYVASSSASKTYNIGYQITFMEVNGNWKIAGFAIDNDLNPKNIKQ